MGSISFVLLIIFILVGRSRLRHLEDQIKRQNALLAGLIRRAADAGIELRPAASESGAREAETDPKPSEEPELPLGLEDREPSEGKRPPVAAQKATPEATPARSRLPEIARAKRDAEAPGQGPAAGTAESMKGLEETLTSQWMVWLGALAVGMSAVFLFTYAIEQGWLGPTTRVFLGLALGAALILGGEWLHRRPSAVPAVARGKDFVPPALTASGLFSLFVSLFAAHGLYDLIAAWLAFPLLGFVSFLALALSIRQGWFVALLGLAGGFAVPALLKSETANALPVFLYLVAVTAGCLGLMVWRHWWWLSFTTLLGALAWPLLWLLGPWVPADQVILGSYAVCLAALFALLSVGLPVKKRDTPATAWLAAVLSDTSGLGFALSGALLVLLAAVCEFNSASFVFLGIYAISGIGFGLRRAAFESLAVVGALVCAVAFLMWPPPVEISLPAELARLGVDRYVTAFGPYIMPPEFVVFARSLLVFAAIFGLGGFLSLVRGSTPPVWAALSAGMPLYLLVLGYWRIGAFEIDVQWAAIAVGLSLANLAAAALLPLVLRGRPRDVALSFFAAGCTAALALAFTCLLREAWLTVAISLEITALAWLWSRLKVEELRLVAYVAAAVVIIRLVLNFNILGYEGSAFGLFSWVIYGYGIPAAAFTAASRLFRKEEPDALVALCEIAGVAFAFLLVALQLRVWTSGAIDQPRYELFDQAVQTIWWLVAAGLMHSRDLVKRASWTRYAGGALLVLACLQIVLGHVLGNNPAFAREPVGSIPILNLLGLAYLVPSVLLWFLGTSPRLALESEFRQPLRIGASALLFVFVSLQVRHFFWGSTMHLSSASVPSNAEIYAYSAAWIIFALALLALGIIQKTSFWRYSSLAVLIATVLKVFLYDMSDLTGLFRVASFLGLGLTLIGIGYIYRMFVFRA